MDKKKKYIAGAIGALAAASLFAWVKLNKIKPSAKKIEQHLAKSGIPPKQAQMAAMCMTSKRTVLPIGKIYITKDGQLYTHTAKKETLAFKKDIHWNLIMPKDVYQFIKTHYFIKSTKESDDCVIVDHVPFELTLVKGYIPHSDVIFLEEGNTYKNYKAHEYRKYRIDESSYASRIVSMYYTEDIAGKKFPLIPSKDWIDTEGLDTEIVEHMVVVKHSPTYLCFRIPEICSLWLHNEIYFDVSQRKWGYAMNKNNTVHLGTEEFVASNRIFLTKETNERYTLTIPSDLFEWLQTKIKEPFNRGYATSSLDDFVRVWQVPLGMLQLKEWTSDLITEVETFQKYTKYRIDTGPNPLYWRTDNESKKNSIIIPNCPPKIKAQFEQEKIPVQLEGGDLLIDCDQNLHKICDIAKWTLKQCSLLSRNSPEGIAPNWMSKKIAVQSGLVKMKISDILHKGEYATFQLRVPVYAQQYGKDACGLIMPTDLFWWIRSITRKNFAGECALAGEPMGEGWMLVRYIPKEMLYMEQYRLFKVTTVRRVGDFLEFRKDVDPETSVYSLKIKDEKKLGLFPLSWFVTDVDNVTAEEEKNIETLVGTFGSLSVDLVRAQTGVGFRNDDIPQICKHIQSIIDAIQVKGWMDESRDPIKEANAFFKAYMQHNTNNYRFLLPIGELHLGEKTVDATSISLACRDLSSWSLKLAAELRPEDITSIREYSFYPDVFFEESPNVFRIDYEKVSIYWMKKYDKNIAIIPKKYLLGELDEQLKKDDFVPLTNADSYVDISKITEDELSKIWISPSKKTREICAIKENLHNELKDVEKLCEAWTSNELYQKL
jgi:hypothetical protein